jgi:hypothetical protein
LARPPAPVRAEPVEALPEGPAAARWTRRLTRYRHLAESARAAAETGWFRAANDRYEREMEALKKPSPRHPGLDPGSTLTCFGGDQEDGCRIKSGMTEVPQPDAVRQAAFTRVTKAENLYDRHTAPLMRTATLLAATPAPDLPALLAKIGVMQAHELQEEGALPKPALELLAEDVARLF